MPPVDSMIVHRSDAPRQLANAAPAALERKSALSREVARLPEASRRWLAVPDVAITVWDLVVTCAAMLVDEDDRRPWRDRLANVFSSHPFSEAHAQEVAAYLTRFAETDLPRWAALLRRQPSQLFLQRLLGAAIYHRLKIALHEDASVVAVALRQGLQQTMPYIVALNDVTAPLTPYQLSQLPPIDVTVGTLLRGALELDQVLCKLVTLGAPLELLTSASEERSPLTVSDLSAFAEQFRQVVSGRSRQVVSDLNTALAHKMRGARDALAYSADPVSQAANSLIELLDRLLRCAFSDDEVMAWVDENYSDAPNMAYADTMTRQLRPTKKARALCFTYAGQRVVQRSGFHELVAAGIVATRAQLQQLKHADTGTIEETHEMLGHLAAVEAFLTLAVGLSWTITPDHQVERLRTRLETRRTAPVQTNSQCA